MKRQNIVLSEFFEHIEEIYQYIKQESPQNAESFRVEVYETMRKIKNTPEAYTPVHSLNGVRKLYRYALVMKSWKLVFKATKSLLVFLGIVHTSRHPNEIKKLRTGKYDK